MDDYRGPYCCALGLALALSLPGPTARATPSGPRIELRAASAHPIRYYLSLPEGYQRRPGKRWPVLVCVAGADADFRGLAERYGRACEGRPFVVVAPCAFSCANALRGPLLQHYRGLYDEDTIRSAGGLGWVPRLKARLVWDEAGLLTILDELAESYDVEARAHLTGFSGGGNLAYRMIFRHPERVAAAALVCANYNFWALDPDDLRATSPGGAKELPIHVLTGGRDPMRPSRAGVPFFPQVMHSALALGVLWPALGWWAWRKTKRVWPVVGAGGAVAALFVALVIGRWSGNEEQNERAVRALRQRGFNGVALRLVPELHHSPAVERVVGLFAAEAARAPRSLSRAEAAGISCPPTGGSRLATRPPAQGSGTPPRASRRLTRDAVLRGALQARRRRDDFHLHHYIFSPPAPARRGLRRRRSSNSGRRGPCRTPAPPCCRRHGTVGRRHSSTAGPARLTSYLGKPNCRLGQLRPLVRLGQFTNTSRETARLFVESLTNSLTVEPEAYRVVTKSCVPASLALKG
jgi:poly(3-hydroxybutyrate) depolymerase